MKRARVAHAGAVWDAVAHPDGLKLSDGRVVAEDAVTWLPPVTPGVIFALGLNYADHAKELAFKAPDEPLVFLKGPNTLIGHPGREPPAGGRSSDARRVRAGRGDRPDGAAGEAGAGL